MSVVTKIAVKKGACAKLYAAKMAIVATVRIRLKKTVTALLTRVTKFRFFL